MIYKTGVAGFDAAALAAENVRAAAERVPGLTQAAATLAAKNYFTSIVAAGASFGVAVPNEQSALNAINATGAP